MATPRKVEFVIGARDRTRAAFRRIRGGLRRLGRSVLSFRTLVGGVFAGVAVRGLTKFAEGLEAVNDNAASLGLTTDELQGLIFAAREVGLSGEDVITIFQRLSRRIGEARDGSGLMIAAFEGMGVSLADLENLSPAEIFDQMVAAARELPRVLADARFGKIIDVEGLRFARLYRTEFDNIAEAVERARAAGFIRSPEQLKAAEEFAESLRRFGDVFGREVVPGLLAFGKIITDNTPTIIAGMNNLTIALKAFVNAMLALPRLGALLGEGTFNAVQRLKGGQGPQLQLAAPLIERALNNLQEIRDISARAEAKGKAGDVSGVYGP